MGLEPRGEFWNEYMHFKVIGQMENEAGIWSHFPMERVKRKKGAARPLGTLTLSENLVCFGEIYQIYMKWHHSLMLYFLEVF